MVRRKDSDKMTVPVPDAKTPPSIPIDEFHGMGGSYVLDPSIGKRTRVEGPKLEQAPTAQELEKMEAIDDESE